MSADPMEQAVDNRAGSVTADEYQAPCIEAVLTSEEMAREMLYAGNVISGDDLSPG